MKLRTRLTAGTLAVWFAFAPIHASADWMQDFYNSAGAASNVTSPQAIASQSVVGYSGGGLTWRVPNKNFQPISISPPSLKAGCGGIDMYLGAYSFPNKEAFVQALRNFGQASVGYFFELALRSMAPEIAVTLEVINDLAQRVNQFSMNSCAAAKKGVDSIAGDFMKANARDASGYARSIGEYVDEADAMMGIQSGGYSKALEEKYKQNYGKAKGSLTSADAGSKIPVDVNVVRWVLDNANSLDLSTDEKDLIMSLVGPTLIIRSGPSDDGSDTVQHNNGKPKTLDFKDLVGTLTGPPAPLNVLVCDSEPECLNPTPSAKAFKPFATRAMEAINAIRTNISSRSAASALAPEHQTVLKLSSVPLYRAAAMAESTGVAAVVADAMLSDLADYGAIDASVKFVNFYLSALDRALAGTGNKLPSNFAPELEGIRSRIKNIRDDMHQQVNHFYKQKGDPFVKIDQLDKAERYMYANLNQMLAANARFGKRH
ncbi:MAG: conjugal transfer protein TraH [Sulfuricella sp.]|nr:conjugal transfer protein TraH [Sulfuricella sp.]